MAEENIIETTEQNGEFAGTHSSKFKTVTIGEGGLKIYLVPTDSLFYKYIAVRKTEGDWTCFTQCEDRDVLNHIIQPFIERGEEMFIVDTSLLVVLD